MRRSLWPRRYLSPKCSAFLGDLTSPFPFPRNCHARRPLASRLVPFRPVRGQRRQRVSLQETPKAAGFCYGFASFALAPPTRVEPVTLGSGNRNSRSPDLQSGWSGTPRKRLPGKRLFREPISPQFQLTYPPAHPARGLPSLCVKCAFALPLLEATPRGVCFGAGVRLGRFSTVPSFRQICSVVNIRLHRISSSAYERALMSSSVNGSSSRRARFSLGQRNA